MTRRMSGSHWVYIFKWRNYGKVEVMCESSMVARMNAGIMNEWSINYFIYCIVQRNAMSNLQPWMPVKSTNIFRFFSPIIYVHSIFNEQCMENFYSTISNVCSAIYNAICHTIPYIHEAYIIYMFAFQLYRKPISTQEKYNIKSSAVGCCSVMGVYGGCGLWQK